MNLDRVIAVRNTKTVYRDGDKCVKVFGESFSKADVLNAALNQARIEETGLSIPKILEVTMDDGKWTIVSEYIRGKTMAQLMAEQPERSGEYLEQFTDLQLGIHSKTCPMLYKLKDRLHRKICMSALDATVRYDLHTRLDGMPKYCRICHGDFNASNVVVSEDGKPYILDWSHATQGDSSADAAKTYLIFLMNGERDRAEKYMKLFCCKSSVSEKYVRKWIPIVAAAQSVSGNESERKFLLSQVKESDN